MALPRASTITSEDLTDGKSYRLIQRYRSNSLRCTTSMGIFRAVLLQIDSIFALIPLGLEGSWSYLGCPHHGIPSLDISAAQLVKFRNQPL